MRTGRLTLLLALVVLALLGTACANPGALLRRIPGPGNDLVYVGSDGNVYRLGLAGSQPRLVTRDQAPSKGQSYYDLWPTISPDGRRIAYMRATLENQNPTLAEIDVVNLDGSGEKQLWQSTTDNPVYYAWSPDSASLAMLVSDGQTVTLLLARSVSAPSAETVTVDNGPEVYFAWSPDSRSLLVHTLANDGGAGSLAQVDVTSPQLVASPLAFQPTAFRAPSWSPSGRYQLIAGAPEGIQPDLYLREAVTGNLRSLGTFGPNAAFAWSPAGDRLAVGSTDASSLSPGYSALTVIDPETNRQTPISQVEPLAFFWSPDGTRLAVLEPAGSPDTVHWVVVDVAGTGRHVLDSFVPDRAYGEMIGYFDQFAESLSIWSPDGQYLAYSGWPERSIVNPDEPSHVYVVRADGTAVANDIGPGAFGYWRRVAAGARP
jgi:Tol biopolymer transport system component